MYVAGFSSRPCVRWSSYLRGHFPWCAPLVPPCATLGDRPNQNRREGVLCRDQGIALTAVLFNLLPGLDSLHAFNYAISFLRSC